MRPLCCFALSLALCVAARAEVVRPAPNFSIEGMSPGSSLRNFHGQAVVLIITRDARNRDFRDQVSRLKSMYSQFSAEKVIFVAAIENGPETIRSNIPFITAANPSQVAADYGVAGKFAIAVIGVDGNLDLITRKVIPAERVRDVVFNNFQTQTTARKQPSS
jgi:hypothetical protein